MQGAEKRNIRPGRDAARIARHIEALGDTKTVQRAERYLIRYGERAREALFAALTHENYLVRCYLPYVAVGIGADWAMDIVRPLLTDPNEDVRYDRSDFSFSGNLLQGTRNKFPTQQERWIKGTNG